MSDPPILADIGEANIAFGNTTFRTDVSTYLHAGQAKNRFTVDLSNMFLEAQAEPFIDLEGINDFS